MPEAKKDKATEPEDIPVSERLTNTEAHPSQTDPSKPAPDKAKAEKATGQDVDKGE